MKPEEVAQKTFDGIKSGSFIIPCNLEGIALSLATAGLSPQRSFLMATVEVLAAGILRIAGLCFQWTWYTSIEKWHNQRKGKCLAGMGEHFLPFSSLINKVLVEINHRRPIKVYLFITIVPIVYLAFSLLVSPSFLFFSVFIIYFFA